MSDLEPITQEETAWANGDLEPVTRKEQYLNRLTGEGQTIPDEPITRTEQYLARLCGEETEIPNSPITREEAYLAYLNGEDVTLPEPITRLEQFMAYAASKSETKPTPLTREEFYWDKYQGGAVLKDFPGLPSSIVTVTDALAKPLDSLKVAITPVQEGSGDPSPDNIRPISGWDSGKIALSSKNLVSDEFLAFRIVTSTRIKRPSYNPVVIKPGKYTVSYTGNKAMYLTNITENYKQTEVSSNPFTFTVAAESEILLRYTANRLVPQSLNTNVMLEAGETATAYEEASILSQQFPQTIYGGTLDVVNGTLTVDRAMVVYDGSNDEAWERHSSGSASAFAMKINLTHAFVNSNANIISNYLTPISSDATWGNHDNWISSSSIGILNTGIKSITDVATWRAYLASNPLEVCYKRINPITYQLTPTEVQMLLGTNNIWADTGDILEGKYWGKRSSATRQMLNTLRDAGEVTEITPEEQEEPEESDER